MISGKSEAGDGLDGAAKKAQFDWHSNDAVAMAVVDTVSSVTDQEPTEMRPLAEIIDSEALDMLFTSWDGAGNAENFVQFEYEGCLVKIDGTGEVTATPLE